MAHVEILHSGTRIVLNITDDGTIAVYFDKNMDGTMLVTMECDDGKVHTQPLSAVQVKALKDWVNK